VACEECERPGAKDWEGEDATCAFDSMGEFVSGNWMCGAMRLLRLAAYRGQGQGSQEDGAAFYFRDDRGPASSIGVVHVPEDEAEEKGGFWVVMSFYKDRGRTSRAYVFSDDSVPLPLNEELAKEAIKILRETGRLPKGK
jgi:hypothetical protein